jgi:hypothetical protein
MRISKTSVGVGAAFLILAIGFNGLDLYRTLFYSVNQFDHVSYNAARLIFVVFLLEIEFALGQGLLQLLRRRWGGLLLGPEEEIAISILSGSAILRAAMLVFGFAGLYFWWLAALGGAVLATAGWDRFAFLWRSFAASRYAAVRERNWFERVALAGVLAALVFAVSEVVAEKLILPNGPSGTGDFYTHYFPYMQHVVASHNIWPNEVWYHFFVSKALGEGFLAILASDPLGVQIASCSMFFAALLIMFCFVERATGDTLIALAAAAVTATGFIWTYDTTLGFQFWADFPKEHVITATLWFGCIWASWRARSIAANDVPAWSVLVATVFCGLILVRVQFAAIAAIFLAGMMIWNSIARRRDLALANAAQLGVVVVAAAFVLGLNYAVMGVAEVTPFRLFWAFADQQKFAHWVSPFLMLLLQLGSSPDLGALSLRDLHTLPMTLFSTMLRLDRAAPFMGPWGATFIIVLGLATIALLRRSEPKARTVVSAVAALLLMLGASGVALIANNQVVSMYRLYMFCMFPVIALVALPFALARARTTGRVAAAIAVVLAIQLLVAVPGQIASVPNQNLVERFALGQVSSAEAFVGEGALWPAGLAMSRVAGAGTPIWNSQLGYYCAAPECNLETFFSFSMGREWATVMFASAGDAQAALRRVGLNFFAFDTSLPFFDILPYAPLFAPAEIERRFGVAWSGNGVYLLTWRSGSTQPVPEDFFQQYARSKTSALQNADFEAMYEALARVYRKWKSDGERWPVRLDPTVPLPRGWQ